MVKKIGNPQGDALDILINAKLGDGGMYQSGVNYYMVFFSKSRDYLEFKRELCEPYLPREIRKAESGYKKGNISYSFGTRSSEEITNIALKSISECIKLLSLKGLYMLYLDDGTYHQKKHFMHIYCNMFSVQETEELANKIYGYYPIKRPTLRWDKKKDGRKYPYLYIPVDTTKALIEDVFEFVEDNQLYSLYYKIGKSIPSTTIETDLKRMG